MTSQKRENTCLKKVSTKTDRKSLSSAVKLDVIRRIEAGEHQIDVCKALVLAGSTVQCILKNKEKLRMKMKRSQSSVVFGFFFKQKGVAWHPSKRDLLFKLNKYFSWSWQRKMLYIVMFIKFMSLLCVLLIVNLILVLKYTSCWD
jgi:hypothetical protein